VRALRQVIVDPGDMQSCAADAMPGWCVLQGASAQAFGCGQAIEFVNGSPPGGTTVALVCP
jgi:hypothetical protein